MASLLHRDLRHGLPVAAPRADASGHAAAAQCVAEPTRTWDAETPDGKGRGGVPRIARGAFTAIALSAVRRLVAHLHQHGHVDLQHVAQFEQSTQRRIHAWPRGFDRAELSALNVGVMR